VGLKLSSVSFVSESSAVTLQIADIFPPYFVISVTTNPRENMTSNTSNRMSTISARLLHRSVR
jgi:hypothetical protein